MSVAVVRSLLSLLPTSARYRATISASSVLHRLQASRLVSGEPSTKLNVGRIVGVHFPKAGGSSLKYQFSEALRSQLVLDYAADPLAGIYGQRRFPADKSMVFGHFHPARYDSATAFRMTFLRHPVASAISKYYFWKTLPDHGHRVHHRFLQEAPTLIDFASYGPITRLMSQTYFGGYDMNRFDFIGFDETRSPDLQRLSRVLGITLSADVHINRTEYGDEYAAAQADPQIHAALTDILATDVAFYDGVRNLVARRC